jgi:hypothetical protein
MDIFSILNILIYVFGILLSVYIYSKYPSIWTILILILYIPISFLVVKQFTKLGGGYKKVIDEYGEVVSGVAVVLKEPEFGEVVEKRVTDSKGRYRFFCKKGEYLLDILSDEYRLISQPINVNCKNRKIVSKKLFVKKIS